MHPLCHAPEPVSHLKVLCWSCNANKLHRGHPVLVFALNTNVCYLNCQAAVVLWVMTRRVSMAQFAGI